MTTETDSAILKALDKLELKIDKLEQKLELKIDKLEQKLDKFIETTQKDLTDLKVGQAELKGEAKNLSTKTENLQKGQDELKSERKTVRTKVTNLYKWIIGLIVTAGLGLGTLLLKAFDFLPIHNP